MIDLLLLGNTGMQPLPDRWLSSLLVRSGGALTLFDCGEGTQIPLKRFGWGFRQIGAICLTHVHADHVAGLPGLLHGMANADRTEPVAIYGPAGTARVVAGLRTIAPDLPYEVTVSDLRGGESFPLPGGLTGSALSGLHRIPVVAYRIHVGRGRGFLRDRAEALGVPQPLWGRLQRGEAARWPGGDATPEQVLGPPRRGLSVGLVTDTRPLPTMPPFLSGVDLLVCEATYGDPADAEKAVAYRHMTFAEAATLARDAGAAALWLTHFSPKLTDPSLWLPQATTVFAATTLGYSGLTTSLVFEP